MQVKYIAALLVLAVAVNSQVLPPLGIPPFGGLPVIPPIFPPFGFGFPFGFPFLGLGFGFGRFGGMGFGRGFGGGFGRFGGGFGRRGRDAEGVEQAEKVAADMKIQEREVSKIVVDPIVTCSLSTKDKFLSCSGVAAHTFKCEVEAQIGESIRSVELRLQDLDFFLPEGAKDFLSLIAPKSKVTAVNPKTEKDILLSVWSGEQEKLNGWRIVSSECWTQVKGLVGALRPEELKVTVSIIPQ